MNELLDSNKKCNVLLHNCRSCKYHYVPDDIDLEYCPECGEKRGRCANSPQVGGKTCKKHGTNFTLMTHPNAIVQSYIDNLPAKYHVTFIKAVNNPDILDMSPGIALLEAREKEIASRLYSEVSDKLWLDLKKAWVDFDNTKYIKDSRMFEIKYAETRAKVENLINNGYNDAVSWGEIRSLQEQMRKLRESEMKRREKMSNMMTKSQVERLIGAVVDAINSNVSDPLVKQNILQQLSLVMRSVDTM